MNTATTPRSRIQRLASLIENDVRRRGLVAGDAYLTAAEASKDFGVDPFTATRAMSLLANRGILVRKRGIGTFVGEKIDVSNEAAITLKQIHVLRDAVPNEPRWYFPIGQILQGLHDKLPSYQIQSTMLSGDNSLATARKIIEKSVADGSLAGLVMVRCNRDVQQMVLEQHIPAVVFGSVFSTTNDLVSIDLDHFEAGYLAAQRLLKSGHQRIMVLMREIWLPGDNKFVEGITHAMSTADATFDALIIRSTCEETAAAKNEIHRFLEMENRPTGLICRSGRLAEIALEEFHSQGLKTPNDFEIIFNYHDTSIAAELGVPCVCPKISCHSLSVMIAEVLIEQFEEIPKKVKRVNLPVQLFDPRF